MSSVFINNLDDYIAPSQACVNPLVLARDGVSTQGATKSSKIRLQTDDFVEDRYTKPSAEIKPDLIKLKSNTTSNVASVSLNDCLACSGCITTAESVLIQEQSYSKLLSKLTSRVAGCPVIVGISPQSIASLAAFTSISTMETFLRISTILKSLGVDYVVDMSAVGDIALIEAREEFLQRYNAGHSNKWIAPPLSSSVSSTTISKLDSGVPQTILIGNPQLSLCLPMLVSQCPGWVCYAEKSQPQSLPFISTSKSAQQIFGRLFREILFEKRNIQRNAPFIVSIQPCFDKKLEASRRDFYHEDELYDEIDLVLSTTELWNLIEEQAKSINSSSLSYFNSAPCDANTGRDEIEELFRSYSLDGKKFIMTAHQEGGSGGYIDHVLRYSAQKLLNIDIWNNLLEYKVGRNPDFAEVEVVNNEGKKLKFAKAYGFRNIQSLMQKMKRGKGSEYDMVEIMACPSGCLNGGGQIKLAGVQETPQVTRERIGLVDKAFHDYIVQRPEESKLVKYVYSPERIGSPLSAKSLEHFHTRYHAVPKLDLIAPLTVKW